jgi:hypothetical protein
MGAVVWGLFGRTRWRRGKVDASTLGGAGTSYWVLRSGSDRLGVLTAGDGAASLFLDAAAGASEEGRRALRLRCLREKDGLGLLASGILLFQAVLVVLVALIWIPNPIVAPGYGLLLLPLWPFTLAWTLMAYARLGFGDSPWTTLDISPDGARWTTWTDYLLYRTAKSVDLRDVAAVGDGLALTVDKVDNEKGEPAKPIVVKLPGGSFSRRAQAELAEQAFREHVAARDAASGGPAAARAAREEAGEGE